VISHQTHRHNQGIQSVHEDFFTVEAIGARIDFELFQEISYRSFASSILAIEKHNV